MPRLASWIVTAPARGAGRLGRSRPSRWLAATRIHVNPTLDRLRSVTERRTARIDHRIRSSACRATSTWCWPKDRRSSRCCASTNGSGSDSHRSFRLSRSSHRRACCRRPRSRTHGRDGSGRAGCRPKRSGRRSNERVWPTTSRPAPSTRSWRVCPGCSTSRAPHLRRLRRARTRRSRRSVRHSRRLPRRRPLVARDVSVSIQPDGGCPSGRDRQARPTRRRR